MDPLNGLCSTTEVADVLYGDFYREVSWGTKFSKTVEMNVRLETTPASLPVAFYDQVNKILKCYDLHISDITAPRSLVSRVTACDNKSDSILIVVKDNILGIF